MKIVVYGAGSFAKQLYDFMSFDSNYEVAAFCVDAEFNNSATFCDLPLVNFEDVDKIFPSNEYRMLLALGYKRMRMRKIIFEKAKAKGYEFVNYIHSSVINSGFVCGENNIVYPGCVIEPGVKLGDNNVIWSMTLLSHDVEIGDHNYIAAKCLIAGNSTIKDLCFIGNGAVFVNGIVISSETQIVAGSVILKSTQECGMYLGNPAKLFKINHQGIEIG